MYCWNLICTIFASPNLFYAKTFMKFDLQCSEWDYIHHKIWFFFLCVCRMDRLHITLNSISKSNTACVCMCLVSTLYVQHVILLRVLFPFSSWNCFRLHFIIVSRIYIYFFLKKKYGKIFGLMNRLSRHIKKANKVEWKMQPYSHRHMHPNKQTKTQQ